MNRIALALATFVCAQFLPAVKLQAAPLSAQTEAVPLPRPSPLREVTNVFVKNPALSRAFMEEKLAASAEEQEATLAAAYHQVGKFVQDALQAESAEARDHHLMKLILMTLAFERGGLTPVFKIKHQGKGPDGEDIFKAEVIATRFPNWSLQKVQDRIRLALEGASEVQVKEIRKSLLGITKTPPEQETKYVGTNWLGEVATVLAKFLDPPMAVAGAKKNPQRPAQAVPAKAVHGVLGKFSGFFGFENLDKK